MTKQSAHTPAKLSSLSRLGGLMPRAARWYRRATAHGDASKAGGAHTAGGPGAVDAYWGRHTVNSKPFKSAQASLDYLQWRFDQYPLFREFMGLYGEHDGEVLVDYGCGPGNDVVGFLAHTRARKVIGVDVSEKALSLARRRLALHETPESRFELIHTSNSVTRIPLDDASVDYVYCEGVLHHTADPLAILTEFHRILRPGGRACVMVYNRDSVWMHLYTAFMKIILENAFAGLTLDEAFGRNTDGVQCPIARCYSAQEFEAPCRKAGFATEYTGGYMSLHELDCLRDFGKKAVDDGRLALVHRDFLRGLTFDSNGYPLHHGKHAGIGGVYQLKK